MRLIAFWGPTADVLVRERLLSIWRFVLAGRGCLLVVRTVLTVPLLVVSFRVGKVEDTLGEQVCFVKSLFCQEFVLSRVIFVNILFGTVGGGHDPYLGG